MGSDPIGQHHALLLGRGEYVGRGAQQQLGQRADQLLVLGGGQLDVTRGPGGWEQRDLRRDRRILSAHRRPPSRASTHGWGRAREAPRRPAAPGAPAARRSTRPAGRQSVPRTPRRRSSRRVRSPARRQAARKPQRAVTQGQGATDASDLAIERVPGVLNGNILRSLSGMERLPGRRGDRPSCWPPPRSGHPWGPPRTASGARPPVVVDAPPPRVLA
jgi:hypothetical protein